MRKNQKFILAVVLSAVMLFGGTSGVALAQEGDGRGQRGALASQVAEILDIDQQDLEDAFKQAQSELREEALDSRLQELVDEGTLTQGQANEFKEWTEARPDIPMVGPKRLQELVDDGVLTQGQVDEFKEWMEARPDIPMIGPKRLHKLAPERLEQLGELKTKAGMGEHSHNRGTGGSGRLFHRFGGPKGQ